MALKLRHVTLRGQSRRVECRRHGGAGRPGAPFGLKRPASEPGVNVELYYKDGKLEFPPTHAGKRTYVTVAGFPYSVPKIYCYFGGDARWHYCGDEIPPGVSVPTVVRDISPYRSPLDGSMVTSRSEHRDHMRRHGVIEVGNERIGTRTPTLPNDRQGRVNDIKRAMGKL